MARTTASSRPLVALACVLGLCLTAGTAQAGDPVEDARVAEAKTLLELLETWRTAGDKAKLEKVLPKLVKVHNGLKTGAMRTKLQSAAGQIIGTESLGAIRIAAADSMGRLNDPKGAYKFLRPHLPSVKETAANKLPLQVIQAVGALAPDSALSTLTKLMQKAKDANVSRYAIQALGKYGWSRSRTKVLSSLAEFLRRLRPGGTDRTKGRVGGAAAQERYAFLQATLVAALRELTGQTKFDTADKWLEAWKTNKKKPASLFVTER